MLAAAPFPLFDLERHAVPKELVLHFAAFGSALLLLRGTRRLSITFTDLLLAAWLALGAVSALGATNGWLAARALGVSLSGALAFWAARALARAGHRQALVGAIALAGVAAAGTALLQAYGIETPLTADTRAPGGSFGNRNFMAHFVAVALPSLLYMALRARSRFATALWAAGGAAMASALILSRSRAAWLGCAAVLVFVAVEGWLQAGIGRRGEPRRRSRWLATALAAGVVGALVLPNRLDWRSDSPYLESLTGVANYREGSGRGRLIQWRNSLRMAEERPVLGVGPGNWPVEYPRFTTPGDPAYRAGAVMPTNPWPSSDWVAILVERGVPAFGALLLAGAALLIRSWRALRAGGEAGAGERGLESLAAMATIVAVVVVGAFDAVLLLAAPSLAAWAALGALAPAGKARWSIELRGRRRACLIGATALAGLALVGYSTAGLAAMHLYTRHRGRPRAELAARLDPGAYRVHMYLARGRHRCAHALAARELFPHTESARRAARGCGGPR